MSKRVMTILLVAIVAALLVSGCGSDGGAPTKDSSRSSTTRLSSSIAPSSATTQGSGGMIYLVKDGVAVGVKRDGIKGGAAALRALLAGPTEAEAASGVTTDVPKGTTLLSYSVSGGNAKADFSKEMLSFGGGSQRVETITEQIKATVLANEPGARTVAISIQGVPAEEAMQP
jgi:Sporulation and spore germination